MPLILFTDEDQPAAPNGPHWRVVVLPPEFVKRLVGWIVRLLTGGA